MQDYSVDRNMALRRLNFGQVDSESEPDLDKRFVRTSDFDEFASEEIWLGLGAKGTGKSALFELLTKYEDSARALASEQLDDVLITAGTGFQDLSEVATGDLHNLKAQENYDHDTLWRLYIAVRAGLALASSNWIPRGPLKELLVAVGQQRDLRIGPLLKSLWRMAIGTPPPEITIGLRGSSITLRGGDRNLDVVTLLEDVESTLVCENKNLWILFDKVDELYPSDRAERINALEGLITAAMSIRRMFPHVRPKVLLRTDLWRHLQFTNKSHLMDKQIELRWSSDQITTLLLKRAIADDLVWELVADQFPRLLEVVKVEEMSTDERLDALGAILPVSAYPGRNEAQFVDWLVTRVTDAQGTVLPREAILLCKYARKIQIENGGAGSESIIGREAIRAAFKELSRARCTSYLAEFPELKEHFRRFEGQTTAQFERAELAELMKGLSPSGNDLLQELFDIGLLEPLQGDVTTADYFEIPRLYRIGLGLVIRGRA